MEKGQKLQYADDTAIRVSSKEDVEKIVYQ